MSGQTLNESIARVSNNIASPRSVYSVFMYQTCSLYMFIWNDVVHCFPNLGTLVAHHSQKQPRVQSWPSHGGFHEWGYPHSWMVFLWTILLRWMMENGGYTCCTSIPSKTHGLKRTPRRVAAVGTLDHREDLRCHQVVPSGADEKLVHWCSFPWRIHGAAIYGFSWIQSIYPLYVSIFYQHHGYPMEVCDRLGLMCCNHRERRKVNPH